MTTLYDQLGVGPKDDQDSVKKAFRQAIKTSHPDINAGDPDAASRFRQIIRANAILSDPELRATYDRMLAFERQQADARTQRGLGSATMQKIFSDAIAIVVLVFVLLGGYAVFLHVSKASDAAIGPSRPRLQPLHAAVAPDAVRDAPARTELVHEGTTPGASRLTARDGGEAAVIAAAPAASAIGGDAIATGRNGIPRAAPAVSEFPHQRTTPGASELAATNGGGEAVFAAAPAANSIGGNAIAATGRNDALREGPVRMESPHERTTPGASEFTATDGRGEAVSTAAPAASTVGGHIIAATGKDGAPDDAPVRTELAHERTTPGASRLTARDGGEAAVIVAAPAASAVGGDATAAISKDGAPRDAKYYREQGILAYRAGDFDRAMVAFDLAIGLDPAFEAAYVDRGTVLYRLGLFDHAFADIARAKRIADANRDKDLSSRRK